MRREDPLCQDGPKLTGSWEPHILNTYRPFLAAHPVVQIYKNHNAWGSLLGLTYSREGDPRGHQVHEGCQAPLFHYWKDKKCHFPYVGCWEPNFRNVCFLESFPPMDFANQLKKTYNREDKPALQNNEIPAKANRKITFLITWCFRLSMRVHILFPPKLSDFLRATVNCIWISKIHQLLGIQSLTRWPNPLLRQWPCLLRNWPRRSLGKTIGT